MIESVKAAVKRYNMFNSQKSVTVALSGGADSVALLFALLEIKDEYGLNLSAAHLNHCLRGEESNGDEQFVKGLCKQLNIPLFCERAEVKSAAEASGDSVELAARQIRYEFLERVSEGLIATAHTADDNIETVLYNMIRGTGLQGVCGIPPVRGRIVRPLIFATRRQVELYCVENSLKYRTDSSNLSDDYTRNKIRHHIVPKLCEINSAAVKNIALLSERARQDESLFKQLAEEKFAECERDGGLNIETLKAMHSSLQYRLICMLAESRLNLCLEHIHIESIKTMLQNGALKQSIKGGCYAVNDSGVLKLIRPEEPAEPFCYNVEKLPFCQKGYSIKRKTIERLEKNSRFNNLFIENSLDYDKISGILRFRSRLPGDSIKLSGRGCTKTFKNLFNEKKLTQSQRDGMAVLSDDIGVVWLAGFGVDTRVAVTEQTKNVVIIEKVK